ncbi:tyrosine-type recombinase/integrase [Chloroflexi bacterium TSY]|nr:tyrosine-type recombinase/integrase [Chloroflexi bacterium TSY]
METTGVESQKKIPLFRKLTSGRQLTDEAMTRHSVIQMIKGYAKKTGLSETICCHTFRVTGITDALINGATLEKVQNLACHVDIRTTMKYDRRDKIVRRKVVERIQI